LKGPAQKSFKSGKHSVNEKTFGAEKGGTIWQSSGEARGKGTGSAKNQGFEGKNLCGEAGDIKTRARHYAPMEKVGQEEGKGG